MKPVQKNFLAEGEQIIQDIYSKVPPQDKATVERVVKAGGTIMFSQQTHKYMQEILNTEGDIAPKLGIGIVQLMLLLNQQTKGKIPLNAWTPAASILLVNAMEFVDKTEGGMTFEIYDQALKIMIAGLSKKVKELTGQGEGTQPGPPTGQPASPALQPTGLINTPQGA